MFGIQREYDSAVYYFEKTLEVLPDRNNLLYRDCVSVMALLRHEAYKDTETSLDSLKSVLAQAPNEVERTVRCQTIGHIYYDNRQYDSAKVYLEPVFEKDPVRAAATAQDLYEIAIHENDTMKANQYARFLVDEDVDAVDNQILNSRLNEIFQNYLREKQEIAAIRQQKKAIKTTLAIALPLVGVLAVVVVILMRCRHRKRLAIQEAEAQRQLNEASQRLSEAAQRLDEAERELGTGGYIGPDSLLMLGTSPVFERMTRLRENAQRIQNKMELNNKSFASLSEYGGQQQSRWRYIPSSAPTRGRVGSGFGPRIHPVTGEVGKVHQGVDLSNERWTPIYATADGIVELAQFSTSFGNYVAINHGNGLKTRYGHMQMYIVKPGQFIRRYQTIGYMGSTGRSTGPHLHYEVWVGDHPVNPVAYILPGDYSVD